MSFKVLFVLVSDFRDLQGKVASARRLDLADNLILARCEVDDRQLEGLEDDPQTLIFPGLEAPASKIKPELVDALHPFIDFSSLSPDSRVLDVLRALRNSRGIHFRAFPIE